jgi:hypothetical protein
MVRRTLEIAERELWTSWQAIEYLLPKALGDLARQALFIESFDAMYEIEQAFIAQTIALAVVIPPRSIYENECAVCPLCGNRSSAPYARGFAYPEGLQRHLEGRSANQCTITKVLTNMAQHGVRYHQENPKST